MAKLLLVVDYQVDFVAESGALTAGAPARAIEDALIKRTRDYRAAGQDVLCTLDTHRPDNWSGQPEGHFPPHCLEDSAGWQLYGKLAELKPATLIKYSYVMAHSDIERLIEQYDAIELAGVATEICVLQNGIALYNHAANIGKKVDFAVRSDCVAALDAEAERFTLNYLAGTLGFTVD